MRQIPVDSQYRADDPGQDLDGTHVVAPDLAYKRLTMVNVVFVGIPGGSDWVLVDTGLPGTAGTIAAAARRRFGEVPPRCIVLTHGHFDHSSNARALSQRWDVPIYAHPLEIPYLDGSQPYPPPDPTVGGGAVSWLMKLAPSEAIDVGDRLEPLPADLHVPGMPDWRWLHTPGHSPGHVSLWRETDRALIVGDAFITTRVESALSVFVQDLEMHGPPMFLTPDWSAARQSVRRLAELEPNLALSGHGRALRGLGLREALDHLARDFDEVAIPAKLRGSVGQPMDPLTPGRT